MQPTSSRYPRRLQQAACSLMAAIALCLAGVAPANAQTLSEAQLRVRFLLNFLRFAEWPENTFASADAPIKVCVLGPLDVFDGALPEIQGASVGTHRIDVQGPVSADAASSCNLLYAPDAELRRLPEARSAIGKRAVLIVGESESALDRGGMVALRSTQRHLAFVVKLGSARDTGLNFSPQMLQAAAEVLP